MVTNHFSHCLTHAFQPGIRTLGFYSLDFDKDIVNDRIIANLYFNKNRFISFIVSSNSIEKDVLQMIEDIERYNTKEAWLL